MQETVNIIKEAESRDLISLYYARLALNLQTSTDPTVDEQLEMFIRWSSDEIATMCNRVFARETIEETFSGFDDGEERLWLSHYPVQEIVSVSEDGDAVDPDGYQLSKQTGRLFRLGTDAVWAGPATITYTGGYNLPFDAPEALQQATVLLLREAYNASVRGDLTIRMVSHKETRVIYFDPNARSAAGGSSGSPARRAAESLLKKYTRFWV